MQGRGPAAWVFSEQTRFEAATAPEVLESLSRRGFGLRVAVQPGQEEAAVDVRRACRRAGVPFGLWPLLADADGRWANVESAEPFAAHARALLDTMARAGATPDELLIDLEPSIRRVRRMLAAPLAGWRRGRSWDRRSERFDEGAAVLAHLVDEVRARGLPVTAAVAPMVVADRPARAGGFQRALGTPVDGIAFDGIAVMAYTSLFEGYGRGFVRRVDARALLEALCAASVARFGARAEMALGVVGGGALGDERPLRDPIELAADAALCRASGVRTLSVYALDGMLARPPLASWLDASGARAPSPSPRATVRARLLTGAARLLSPALAAVARSRER